MLRTLLLLISMSLVALGADISGKWNMTVESDMGTGTPVFVFKQVGEKLSGTYAGQLGEAPLTGTVKGDSVEFSFEVSPGGDKITAKYTGKLESPSAMKGTVD